LSSRNSLSCPALTGNLSLVPTILNDFACTSNPVGARGSGFISPVISMDASICSLSAWEKFASPTTSFSMTHCIISLASRSTTNFILLDPRSRYTQPRIATVPLPFCIACFIDRNSMFITVTSRVHFGLKGFWFSMPCCRTPDTRHSDFRYLISG